MFIVATLQLQFSIIVPVLCQDITGSLASPEALLFPESIKFQRLKKYIPSRPRFGVRWFQWCITIALNPRRSCSCSFAELLVFRIFAVLNLWLQNSHCTCSSHLFYSLGSESNCLRFLFLISAPAGGSRSLNPCISSDSRFHSLLNVSRPGSGLNGGRELPLSRIFKP